MPETRRFESRARLKAPPEALWPLLAIRSVRPALLLRLEVEHAPRLSRPWASAAPIAAGLAALALWQAGSLKVGGIFLAVAVAALLGAAAARHPAEAPPHDAQAAERLRAHLAFLADDLLEGRFTGSPGYEIAARYVAAQLRQLGLRPAAGDSYLLPVPLVASSIVVDGVVLEIVADGKRTPLPWADGFVADGTVSLLGANVGGNLDCTAALLDGRGRPALALDDATVNGNVTAHLCFDAVFDPRRLARHRVLELKTNHRVG